MFTVTGVSTLNGQTKVRFANDLVSRVKILNKSGHKDVTLFEVTALTKGDCVKFLKSHDIYKDSRFTAAIDAADAKYNGATTVKVSMDSLKARAEAVKSADAVTA